MTLIDHHRPRLRTLCRRHRVLRLWAFGSVLRPDFGPHSDVDLLYELDDPAIPDAAYTRNYFDLTRALRTLFGRPVDFVSYVDVRNPYLKEELDQTKELIYDQTAEGVRPQASAPSRCSATPTCPPGWIAGRPGFRVSVPAGRPARLESGKLSCAGYGDPAQR